MSFFDDSACHLPLLFVLLKSFPVNVVVFLAPISVFDQCMEEDPKINRLQDCLNQWKGK